MSTSKKTNAQLFERAQKVIPGGVNSPVRAFRAVGGTPRFIARAQGPYIFDAEGTRFVGRAHDNSPPGAPGDGDRYAAELRVVTLVHRRVESVEVDVEDRSRPVLGSRHSVSRQSATTTCGLLTFRALLVAV